MPLAALVATGVELALVENFVEIEMAKAEEDERVLVVSRMEVQMGGLNGGRRQNPTHLEIRQHKKVFFLKNLIDNFDSQKEKLLSLYYV